MRIKEVRVSSKFVKNLGNYQSLATEAGATIEVDPGENPEEVFAKGWEMVKAQITEQVKSLKKKEES